MGLDMYLYEHRYVGAQHRKIKPQYITVSKYTIYSNNENKDTFKDGIKYPTKNMAYVVYEVGYWRKANWIHKWFVDNVQEGKDDCRYVQVPCAKLAKLLKLCSDLVKHKYKQSAIKLLPPCGGYFFGSTNAEKGPDGWSSEFWDEYWDSLEYTCKVLTDAIARAEKGEAIFYRSSW